MSDVVRLMSKRVRKGSCHDLDILQNSRCKVLQMPGSKVS